MRNNDTYKLPIWEKIEDALNTYHDDPNFKEQKKQHRQVEHEIYDYVYGYDQNSPAGVVHPAVRETNLTILDKMDKFKLEVTPSKQHIEERLKFYQEKEKKGELTPEEKKYYKAAQVLAGLHTDTAYIMPTYEESTGRLVYMINIGADLYHALKNKALDSEELAKAMNFAMYHENMHYVRGDVTPWRNEILGKYYKHVDHGTWNILQDTLINSTGLRVFKDTASALLDHLGVRGATIPDFNKRIAVLQALDDMKDKIKPGTFNDMLKTGKFVNNEILNSLVERSNNYLRELGADGEITLESIIGNLDSMDELLENLKKAKDAKSHFAELTSKWQNEFEQFKETGGLPKGLNLPERYIDVIALWAGNARAYENDDAAMLHEGIIADYLDKIYELLPSKSKGGSRGKGGGGGGGEGECGSGPESQDHANQKGLPEDVMKEINPDDMDAARAEDVERRGEITEEIEEINKRHNTVGAGMGQSNEKQLKYTKDALMYDAIKRAITASIPDIEEEIEKQVKPVINAPLQQSMESSMPADSFAQPKGVVTHLREPKGVPKVVFVAFDESASVDDGMLAAAKSAIHDVCKEQNLVVIGLSGSYGMMEGGAKAVQSIVHSPKTQDPEHFVKRMQDGGGTDHIIDTILAIPELLKDKKWKAQLDKQLQEAGVDFNTDDIQKAFEEGKIHAIGVTDGYIPDRVITGKEKPMLTKFASKLTDTFMRIVSWNPVSGKLEGLPENIIKKLVKVIVVGGK